MLDNFYGYWHQTSLLSSLMISMIEEMSSSNYSLVILPSPFTSSARAKLSISAKEGSSTWKAIASRLISWPNSFFSSTPDLSTSKFRKAALSSFLATLIINSVSILDRSVSIKNNNCLSFLLYQFDEAESIQDKKEINLQVYLLGSERSKKSLFFQVQQLMAQKKINGYTIFMKEELGKGSYGSVYRGTQDGTKKECAIKVVQKRSIDHDDYLKNALFSEIQIMQMLKSENIVKVMDVMESCNNYYIIQQICDSDLEKYLKTKGKLPEDEAINFLKQICNGFIMLAKEGIIHRDVKPANLLLSKGVIKIGDFGFAKKNVTKRIKNMSVVGTPLYWPLQILKSLSYTSKCDIWAVGCIFYEMLHGKTPWSASTEYELINNIEQKPLVINPNLQKDTKDFITNTLKCEENERLSWDDVFLHPIFKGQFNHYAEENHYFQDQLKRVMGELRFEINSKNIDLDRLLDGLGFKHNQELNFEEFSEFLRHIHPKITKNEVKFFFEKMDANADGSISMQELELEMERHRISFNKNNQQQTKFIKHFASLGGNEEKVMPSELQVKVKKCFLKLHKILTTKKLTLSATYNAYDTDRNGQLTIDEFQKIMKRLDTSFSEQELIEVFNFIDTDQSKTITFEQLNSYYCKVNGIPPSLALPKNK